MAYQIQIALTKFCICHSHRKQYSYG